MAANSPSTKAYGLAVGLDNSDTALSNISKAPDSMSEGFVNAVDGFDSIAEHLDKSLVLSSAADKVVGICQPQCTKDISDCLAGLEVPFLRNTDTAWDDYAQTYNVRLPCEPRVIVLPDTAAQVAEAVLCAAHHGLPVQAKSGGHSYASFSNGGTDGSVVIHLGRLKDVHVDEVTGVARVGGGVRLGPLGMAIYDQERRDGSGTMRRALAHGTCPSVGIGGHYTHGGYGHFSRAWGLAMDQIVAMDVVLANGTMVRASRYEHKDVFYAMRGAAETIGIAVNFYLQTHAAPENVVYWTLELPSAAPNVSVDNAIAVFSALQELVHDAAVVDRRLSFGVVLEAGSFRIGGTYLGCLAEFESKIAPELRRCGNAATSTGSYDALHSNPDINATELVWLEALDILSGECSGLVVPEPYLERRNFYAHGTTVKEPGILPSNLRSYFRYMADQGQSTDHDWFVILNLHGGADSQINTDEKNDPKYSAYCSRNLAWVAQHFAFVDNREEFPKNGIAFVNGLSEVLTDGIPDAFRYVNYVDSEMSKSNAMVRYYGPELLAELKRIKTKVDPDNVFANPQSIDPVRPEQPSSSHESTKE